MSMAMGHSSSHKNFCFHMAYRLPGGWPGAGFSQQNVSGINVFGPESEQSRWCTCSETTT